MRDYDFWIYIITNAHDSMLYIGMTNDLARRVSEHRSGEIRGFTSAHRCHKLLYYEHYTEVQDAIARETATEEMVALKEACADRNHESALERSCASCAKRRARDVSASLDMTKVSHHSERNRGAE